MSLAPICGRTEPTAPGALLLPPSAPGRPATVVSPGARFAAQPRESRSRGLSLGAWIQPSAIAALWLCLTVGCDRPSPPATAGPNSPAPSATNSESRRPDPTPTLASFSTLAPGWTQLGERPSTRVPRAIAWEGTTALWFDDSSTRSVVRRDASGVESSFPWPEGGRAIHALHWEARPAEPGVLVGLDRDARLLIRWRLPDPEPKTESLGQGFLPGPLIADPSGAVELWTALEAPTAPAQPVAFRGLPAPDGSRIRTTVVDAGPVLLQSRADGTVRRLVLSKIPQAADLRLVGITRDLSVWTVATAPPSPGRGPERHLVALSLDGEVRERAPAPDTFSAEPPSPGRAFAEYAAAVDDRGRVLWAAPAPKGTALFVYQPGTGHTGPTLR